MIKIHKSTETGLEVVDQPAKGCWVNLIDPSAEETQQVAQDLGLDPGLLRFPLSRESISRVEKVDDGLRILVRIPHHQRANANVPK
jgi:magnesium transporter